MIHGPAASEKIHIVLVNVGSYAEPELQSGKTQWNCATPVPVTRALSKTGFDEFDKFTGVLGEKTKTNVAN